MKFIFHFTPSRFISHSHSNTLCASAYSERRGSVEYMHQNPSLVAGAPLPPTEATVQNDKDLDVEVGYFHCKFYKLTVTWRHINTVYRHPDSNTAICGKEIGNFQKSVFQTIVPQVFATNVKSCTNHYVNSFKTLCMRASTIGHAKDAEFIYVIHSLLNYHSHAVTPTNILNVKCMYIVKSKTFNIHKEWGTILLKTLRVLCAASSFRSQLKFYAFWRLTAHTATPCLCLHTSTVTAASLLITALCCPQKTVPFFLVSTSTSRIFNNK